MRFGRLLNSKTATRALDPTTKPPLSKFQLKKTAVCYESVLEEFFGRVYKAHAQLWACHGTGRLAVDAGWGSAVSEMACNPRAAAPAVRDHRSNPNPVNTRLHAAPFASYSADKA